MIVKNPIWLIVLVMVIAASILTQCDCRNAGGVLVKSASGGYVCVQELKK